MALQFPSWLEWLEWVVGADWPHGNEDRMWEMGRDLTAVANDTKALVPDLQAMIGEVNAAYPSGQGGESIIAWITPLLDGTDGDKHGSLASLGEEWSSLAVSADAMGDELQAAKLNFYIAGVWLMSELALAACAGPGAPAAEAAAIASARTFFRLLSKRLLAAIENTLLRKITNAAARKVVAGLVFEVFQEAVVETLQGTSQELLVQYIQNQTGHVDGYDWDKVKLNAGISAIAGAAGGGVGFGVGRALPTGAGGVKGMTNGALTGMIAGAAGAGAAWLATGAFTGHWEFDPRSLTGGALSGAGPSAIHGYRGGAANPATPGTPGSATDTNQSSKELDTGSRGSTGGTDSVTGTNGRDGATGNSTSNVAPSATNAANDRPGASPKVADANSSAPVAATAPTSATPDAVGESAINGTSTGIEAPSNAVSEVSPATTAEPVANDGQAVTSEASPDAASPKPDAAATDTAVPQSDNALESRPQVSEQADSVAPTEAAPTTNPATSSVVSSLASPSPTAAVVTPTSPPGVVSSAPAAVSSAPAAVPSATTVTPASTVNAAPAQTGADAREPNAAKPAPTSQNPNTVSPSTPVTGPRAGASPHIPAMGITAPVQASSTNIDPPVAMASAEAAILHQQPTPVQEIAADDTREMATHYKSNSRLLGGEITFGELSPKAKQLANALAENESIPIRPGEINIGHLAELQKFASLEHAVIQNSKGDLRLFRGGERSTIIPTNLKDTYNFILHTHPEDRLPGPPSEEERRLRPDVVDSMHKDVTYKETPHIEAVVSRDGQVRFFTNEGVLDLPQGGHPRGGPINDRGYVVPVEGLTSRDPSNPGRAISGNPSDPANPDHRTSEEGATPNTSVPRPNVGVPHDGGRPGSTTENGPSESTTDTSNEQPATSVATDTSSLSSDPEQTMHDAIDQALAGHPEVASIIHRLVNDVGHPLNLTDAIRDPGRRDAALEILREISQSQLLDGTSITEFVAQNPGQGPLFDPLTPGVNHLPDGRARMAALVADSKLLDPARQVGANPTDTEQVLVDDYARRLVHDVEPAVEAELARLTEGLDGVTTNLRTKPADAIIDKVQRMVNGNERRRPRPDYQVGDAIDAIGARITVNNTVHLAQVLDRVQQLIGSGDGGRIVEIDNMYVTPKGNPGYRVIPLVIRIDVDGIPYTYELQLTTRRASIAADIEHNTIFKPYVPLNADERALVNQLFAEAAALDQLENRPDHNSPQSPIRTIPNTTEPPEARPGTSPSPDEHTPTHTNNIPNADTRPPTEAELRQLRIETAQANTPTHVPSLDDTRIIGSERLAPLEDNAYLQAVQDALLDDDHFIMGADPRTNDYGRLINDGGPTVDGRWYNCLDTALAGLSSFLGRPAVALPRNEEYLPDGRLDQRGELGGLDRAANWIGGSWQNFDGQGMSIPEQFTALHDWITQMGPGSAAFVYNQWHARDTDGQLMFDEDGNPVDGGSHATIIVFPHGADSPVWWDPQSKEMSDKPPTTMTERSLDLAFISIDSDGGTVSAKSTAGNQGTSSTVSGPSPQGFGGIRNIGIPNLLGMSADIPTGVEPGPQSGERLLRSEQTNGAGDRAREQSPDRSDRAGVRQGDAERTAHRGLPDLSPTMASEVSTDTRVPDRNRVPSSSTIADESAVGGQRPTVDDRQTSAQLPNEHRQNPSEQHQGERLGTDAQPSGRDLAGPGHDRALNSSNNASLPASDSAPQPASDVAQAWEQSGGAVRPRDPSYDDEWAAEAYDHFRSYDGDIARIVATLADIQRSDGSTGFTDTEIAQIKNHLMREQHLLRDYDNGGFILARFDPSPDQAEAWIRLATGRQLPQDIVMLEHELTESNYMRAHPEATYPDAHAVANQAHNWAADIPARTGERYDHTWETNDGTTGVLRPSPGDPDTGGIPVRDNRGRSQPNFVVQQTDSRFSDDQQSDGRSRPGNSRSDSAQGKDGGRLAEGRNNPVLSSPDTQASPEQTPNPALDGHTPSANPDSELDIPEDSERSVPEPMPLNSEVIESQHGIPVENQRKIQRYVDANNLILEVRPTNPDAVRHIRAGAAYKPMAIKDKTINDLDIELGAPAHAKGLVGRFAPGMLSMPDTAEMSPEHRRNLQARLDRRNSDWLKYQKSMDRLTLDNSGQGEFQVVDGIVERRTVDGWKPITGDHDLFDVRHADGSRLTPAEIDELVTALHTIGAGIEHGPHKYWETFDPYQRRENFEKIVNDHRYDADPDTTHEPVIQFARDTQPTALWSPDSVADVDRAMTPWFAGADIDLGVTSRLATIEQQTNDHFDAVNPAANPAEREAHTEALQAQITHEAELLHARVAELVANPDFDHATYRAWMADNTKTAVNADRIAMTAIAVTEETMIVVPTDSPEHELTVLRRAAEAGQTLAEIRATIDEQLHPDNRGTPPSDSPHSNTPTPDAAATSAPSNEATETGLTPQEQIAKDACDQLPRAVRDALVDYAGDAYAEINRHLRFGEPLDTVTTETIELIRSGLAALPNHIGPVKRSLMLSPEEMQKFWYENRVDSVVEDPGFVSTSKNKFKWNPTVELTILSASGKDISFLHPPEKRGEAEVLIPDGRQFRVLYRRMDANGIMHVIWAEVADTSQSPDGVHSDSHTPMQDQEPDQLFPRDLIPATDTALNLPGIEPAGTPHQHAAEIEQTTQTPASPPSTPAPSPPLNNDTLGTTSDSNQSGENGADHAPEGQPTELTSELRDRFNRLQSLAAEISQVAGAPARVGELAGLRAEFADQLGRLGLMDNATAHVPWRLLGEHDPSFVKFLTDNHTMLLPQAHDPAVAHEARPHDGDEPSTTHQSLPNDPTTDLPGAERTDAGVSFHRDDPSMAELARQVRPDPARFTVDVHLTQDGRPLFGGRTHTLAELAPVIRAAGWDGHTPIRLIGCDAATNGFAGALARHLGVEVLAPTKTAWSDSQGRVFSSTPEPRIDGSRRPRIPPDGQWQTFRPDGSATVASRDGFVPGTRDQDRHGIDPNQAGERAASSSENDPDSNGRPTNTSPDSGELTGPNTPEPIARHIPTNPLVREQLSSLSRQITEAAAEQHSARRRLSTLARQVGVDPHTAGPRTVADNIRAHVKAQIATEAKVYDLQPSTPDEMVSLSHQRHAAERTIDALVAVNERAQQQLDRYLSARAIESDLRSAAARRAVADILAAAGADIRSDGYGVVPGRPPRAVAVSTTDPHTVLDEQHMRELKDAGIGVDYRRVVIDDAGNVHVFDLGTSEQHAETQPVSGPIAALGDSYRAGNRALEATRQQAVEQLTNTLRQDGGATRPESLLQRHPAVSSRIDQARASAIERLHQTHHAAATELDNAARTALRHLSEPQSVPVAESAAPEAAAATTPTRPRNWLRGIVTGLRERVAMWNQAAATAKHPSGSGLDGQGQNHIFHTPSRINAANDQRHSGESEALAEVQAPNAARILHELAILIKNRELLKRHFRGWTETVSDAPPPRRADGTPYRYWDEGTAENAEDPDFARLEAERTAAIWQHLATPNNTDPASPETPTQIVEQNPELVRRLQHAMAPAPDTRFADANPVDPTQLEPDARAAYADALRHATLLQRQADGLGLTLTDLGPNGLRQATADLHARDVRLAGAIEAAIDTWQRYRAEDANIPFSREIDVTRTNPGARLLREIAGERGTFIDRSVGNPANMGSGPEFSRPQDEAIWQAEAARRTSLRNEAAAWAAYLDVPDVVTAADSRNHEQLLRDRLATDIRQRADFVHRSEQYLRAQARLDSLTGVDRVPAESEHALYRLTAAELDLPADVDLAVVELAGRLAVDRAALDPARIRETLDALRRDNVLRAGRVEAMAAMAHHEVAWAAAVAASESESEHNQPMPVVEPGQLFPVPSHVDSAAFLRDIAGSHDISTALSSGRTSTDPNTDWLRFALVYDTHLKSHEVDIVGDVVRADITVLTDLLSQQESAPAPDPARTADRLRAEIARREGWLDTLRATTTKPDADRISATHTEIRAEIVRRAAEIEALADLTIRNAHPLRNAGPAARQRPGVDPLTDTASQLVDRLTGTAAMIVEEFEQLAHALDASADTSLAEGASWETVGPPVRHVTTTPEVAATLAELASDIERTADQRDSAAAELQVLARNLGLDPDIRGPRQAWQSITDHLGPRRSAAQRVLDHGAAHVSEHLDARAAIEEADRYQELADQAMFDYLQARDQVDNVRTELLARAAADVLEAAGAVDHYKGVGTLPSPTPNVLVVSADADPHQHTLSANDHRRLVEADVAVTFRRVLIGDRGEVHVIDLRLHRDGDPTSGPNGQTQVPPPDSTMLAGPSTDPNTRTQPSPEPHSPEQQGNPSSPEGTRNGLLPDYNSVDYGFSVNPVQAHEDPMLEQHMRALLASTNGGFETHFDPRTHPAAALVNGEGPDGPGRRNNCGWAAMAGLSTFFGDPRVAPRMLPVIGPNGSTVYQGGLDREYISSWLATDWLQFNPTMDIADQYRALHRLLTELGPGSAAYVATRWQRLDRQGNRVFRPDGTPRLTGGHATLVVFPRDSDTPVWWDTQELTATDSPPETMLREAGGLQVCIVRADGTVLDLRDAADLADLADHHQIAATDSWAPRHTIPGLPHSTGSQTANRESGRSPRSQTTAAHQPHSGDPTVPLPFGERTDAGVSFHRDDPSLAGLARLVRETATETSTTEVDTTSNTTIDLDAIHNNHAEQTPAGISHHRGDPTMGDLPHRVPADPNRFTADTHITPDGHAVIGGQTLTPEQYGDLLRRSGWDGVTPIRLIGCDASTNGFADRLAQHLGVEVLAPTQAAWTDANGNVFSASTVTNPDGSRSPRVPPDGQWQTHHSNGTNSINDTNAHAPSSRPGNLNAESAVSRAVRPGDRVNPTHNDIDWQAPPFDQTVNRVVQDGEPFYSIHRDPADNPTLEPRTRYEIADSTGRRTTVYTDDSNPPRITHVDTEVDNTRTGYPGNPVANPDASYPLPDVDYRVDTGHPEPFTFRTDASGRPQFELDTFGCPTGPDFQVGGDNYRPIQDWNASNQPFSSRTDLEPNCRYEVFDQNGNWHGDFYTGPADPETGQSSFTHIETWTNNNPELGNASTMRRNDLRSPGDSLADGLPHTNTRYRVGDRVFHTDDVANGSTSFRPDYSPGGHPPRAGSVQARVGNAGEIDYPGQDFRGGHTHDHVAGSINEALGLFSQLWRENNILLPSTDPLSRHNDSWRRSEMDRHNLHRAGHALERARVFPSNSSVGVTPDYAYWIVQETNPNSNRIVLHFRSHQNF
ncbi:toxin glutamine deamidase domain-containing protein [Nocardia sp. NPDC058666]|uniref:toxin glutamine deamidase domain-containing protein n=1 Tax=unclassified Nocardia TaxID=2637762 RepID=UPI00364AE639